MKKVIACTWLYISAFCCMALFCACSGGDDGEDGPVVNTDILNVESANITIGGNELTATIKITANCHWVIQKQAGTDGDWLTVSPTEGRADATVTLTANSANPSSVYNRKMTLVIKSDGGISRNIIVTQTTSTESIEISPSSISFTSASETKEVTIISNTHWSVTGGANWITLDKTEGDNNGTITISVKENESSEPRYAELTFKGVGSIFTLLSIQQAGIPSDIEGISAPTIITTDKHSAKVSFEYNLINPVSSYGVCYSTSGDPTTANPHVSEQSSSSSGTPTLELTSLSSATTYYVRAYVVSEGNVQYSATSQFTTLSSQPGNDDNVTPNI